MDDRAAVIETVTRYATALDSRDWALLDEVLAPEYRDQLMRTPDGWRIARREMRIHHEIGSREVLGSKPRRADSSAV